ncbi:MAG TPA: S-adenosylmethionine:tRNA ribosyltransferase-isomerase [Casimicrobiaceae bacterium]
MMRIDPRVAEPLSPARRPVQRPADARLLAVDAEGRLTQLRRARWMDALQRGDLVVANDAATLPASLPARHARSRRTVELRLAGHLPRGMDGTPRFIAVVFGEGDWRTRTEDRPLPPALEPGDRLATGDAAVVVEALAEHPRLARVRFDMSDAALWSLLARRGRPIQYAHLDVELAPWDVWTPIASVPLAFEAPSAGFAIDWQGMQALRRRGIGFATLTHAAGISSTGDAELDARLPLPEPYHIPVATARAIERTRTGGGRIVAIGTTVVRALEHAAACDGIVSAGHGVADQRIGASTRLRIVDMLLTGTHEPGSSHYDVLRAFTGDETLARATLQLADSGYRTHEFGDSMLVERTPRASAGPTRARTPREPGPWSTRNSSTTTRSTDPSTHDASARAREPSVRSSC